ncbi:DUF3363 domain-containing protein [Novosphingobium sp. CECT 9465]|uniref:relaxase/mobilization nuclease domain-containing protein n=1 Tax=Novosphingobium sp. CECT 9465 TaxID=2829794 RepID=UPI001E639189|nr:DUF3363 domain-containing protein [Novosphingobium sp. CECT 9465]CAH0496437.1 hypothetical protein NVSP9465_01471 [Novosphingobium sp. CECT 9465]
MSTDDNDFSVRPGKGRDAGQGSGRRSQSLAAQVRRAAARAGYARRGNARGKGTGTLGRGRIAQLRLTAGSHRRRVVIKARVVRHKGARFRAAPMARHIAYLKRDGVTRDGREGILFDASNDQADGEAFAGRCADDRHHFRFIVSPEDADQMADLKAFTRELMRDMSQDLETQLDWVATDHWNTDNPHVHVLVRGVAHDGRDLIIDRDYIRAGLRARAEERVTIELGLRSEQDLRTALEREVEADRWTSLDRRLQRLAEELSGIADLRPSSGDDPEVRRLLIGRAEKLERLGLAGREGAGLWTIKPDAEATLRDLSIRTDIIKTMHRAFAGKGRDPDVAAFVLHDGPPAAPVIGRLAERGHYDELSGTAYAIIEATDGRTHHLRFDNLELTGDAAPGSIVEVRSWADRNGTPRMSLATRSDLSLGEQITARGATWLDRQLLARDPIATGTGFVDEVQDALAARSAHLETQGLAKAQPGGFVFARNLIETLQARDVAQAANEIAVETGLTHQPSASGAYVSGTYRARVDLSSGRFAMIDDGLSFQLVPWRPALEPHLGKHVTGTLTPTGSVDWALGKGRGIGL